MVCWNYSVSVRAKIKRVNGICVTAACQARGDIGGPSRFRRASLIRLARRWGRFGGARGRGGGGSGVRSGGAGRYGRSRPAIGRRCRGPRSGCRNARSPRLQEGDRVADVLHALFGLLDRSVVLGLARRLVQERPKDLLCLLVDDYCLVLTACTLFFLLLF